jgi:uncharacterized protein YqgV (UPF0045/DUF77 family)
VHRVEFTIEPFEEGKPGRHVIAPADALRAKGYDVEFGPFGTTCVVPAGELAAAVSAVLDAAFGNGATHVNVDVERVAGP